MWRKWEGAKLRAIARVTAAIIIIVVIVIAAGVGVFYYYQLQSSATPKLQEIKVGFTISNEGSFAIESAEQLRGFEIWNATTGTNGIKVNGTQIPVKFVYYDDQSNPSTALTLYQKLATVDKVQAFMAPFGSSLTSTVAPMSDRYGIFMLTISASAPTLYSAGYKYFVSGTNLYSYDFPKAAVQFMASKYPQIKTAAILYENQPYPSQLAQGEDTHLKENGINVTYYQSFPSGTTSFISILKTIQATNVSAFFAETAAQPTAVQIIQQMKEVSYAPEMFFNSYFGINPYSMISALGNDSYGMIGFAQWTASVSYPVTLGLTDQQFLQKYSQMFPSAPPPDVNCLSAYANMLLLQHAIEETGSINATVLKQAALNMNNEHVVTLLGDYQILPSGQQVGPVQFPIQIQLNATSGKLQPYIVWPSDVANTNSIVFPLPAWNEPNRP